MCQLSQLETTVTLEQAAEFIGTTPMNILMHLKYKLIVGTEANGSWSIDSKSLHAFKKEHHGKDRTLCKKHTCQHSQNSACGSCE